MEGRYRLGGMTAGEVIGYWVRRTNLVGGLI